MKACHSGRTYGASRTWPGAPCGSARKAKRSAPRVGREWQERERVEERGEAIDREAREWGDEGQRDPERVRPEADREQPAFLTDAARGRVIADEPLIMRRVQKDTGEGHRDEHRTEAVDDERGGRAALREDVLVDERRREGNDPDGDQQQEIEIEEAPIDAPAVLEQRVVVHPDDAYREEAHEVRRIGRPEPQERGGKVGGLGSYAELEDEQGRRDGEHAATQRVEPAAAHEPSLNEQQEQTTASARQRCRGSTLRPAGPLQGHVRATGG